LGKKKKKTKTVNEPWKPMQQPIINSVNTASGIVTANQGNLDQLAGDVRAHLPTLQSMAFNPNPALQAGQGYAQDVLGGKYLGQGNPYMQGMLDETRQNVGNQVNSTFSMAGRTGGGNHAERLGQGLATAENQLRYADYDAERNRMAQQSALLPGLAQAQFAGMQPWMAATSLAGTLPYAGVGALNPIIGLAAGSGTSKTTESKSLGQSIMDAAAAAAAAYAQSGSDPRIKENVEKVGELAPGLGLYEWDYRQDMGFDLPEGRYRGVMANEVAIVAPWALGTPMHGYMTVRYTPERVG
jgi:hypothetical protein